MHPLDGAISECERCHDVDELIEVILEDANGGERSEAWCANCALDCAHEAPTDAREGGQ